MAEEDENLRSIKAQRDAAQAAQDLKKSNQDMAESFRLSADLSKKLNTNLTEASSIIDDVKEGNGDISELLKKQAETEKLINKLKRENRILELEGSDVANDLIKANQSQIDSSQAIVNTAQVEIDIQSDKIAKQKKSEDMMKNLSDLTGGLSDKALAFGKALNGPKLIVAAIVGLMKMLLDVNQEITEIGKGLGVSANEARNVRANFAAIQGASSNVLNTTKEISKAQGTLNEALGTSATMISGKILDGMATLQNRMGLSAEAATSFAQSAMLSGQSVEQLKLAAIGSATAVERERGTRLDIRGILKETGTITGQIRAQLGGSVEAIASAVAKAKSLGMELKGVAAAGKQLLNFEQSISAELEAELLTGRQINLERARLAALTGDYSTLTEEINANVGDFYEFSKLNVIQQESLAKAVGMEADALADILMKKENIASLTERARIEGNEDLARNLEQLSVQQKFNAAIEKLKVVVVNLVAKLESTPLISSLFNLAGAGFETAGIAAGSVGAGTEANIEGAIERGMSKARINVSTKYDSFRANSRVGNAYQGGITNRTSYV